MRWSGVAALLFLHSCLALRPHSDSESDRTPDIAPPISLSGNTDAASVEAFELELLGCSSGHRGFFLYTWEPTTLAQPLIPGQELRLIEGDRNCSVQLRTITFNGERYVGRSTHREMAGDVITFEKSDARDSILNVTVAKTIPMDAIPAGGSAIAYEISESSQRTAYVETLTYDNLKVTFTSAVPVSDWEITVSSCIAAPTLISATAPFHNPRLRTCAFALTKANIGGDEFIMDAAIGVAEGTATLRHGTDYRYAKSVFTAPNQLNIEISESFPGIRFYADFDGVAGDVEASAIRASSGDCSKANTVLPRLTLQGSLTADRRTAFVLNGDQSALHLGETLCDFRVSSFIRRGTLRRFTPDPPDVFWEQGTTLDFFHDSRQVNMTRQPGNAEGKFLAQGSTLIRFYEDLDGKMAARQPHAGPLPPVIAPGFPPPPPPPPGSLPPDPMETIHVRFPIVTDTGDEAAITVFATDTIPFEVRCEDATGTLGLVPSADMAWVGATNTLSVPGKFRSCQVADVRRLIAGGLELVGPGELETNDRRFAVTFGPSNLVPIVKGGTTEIDVPVLKLRIIGKETDDNALKNTTTRFTRVRTTILAGAKLEDAVAFLNYHNKASGTQSTAVVDDDFAISKIANTGALNFGPLLAKIPIGGAFVFSKFVQRGDLRPLTFAPVRWRGTKKVRIINSKISYDGLIEILNQSGATDLEWKHQTAAICHPIDGFNRDACDAQSCFTTQDDGSTLGDPRTCRTFKEARDNLEPATHNDMEWTVCIDHAGSKDADRSGATKQCKPRLCTQFDAINNLSTRKSVCIGLGGYCKMSGDHCIKAY